jgi:hypothetical protein
LFSPTYAQTFFMKKLVNDWYARRLLYLVHKFFRRSVANLAVPRISRLLPCPALNYRLMACETYR